MKRAVITKMIIRLGLICGLGIVRLAAQNPVYVPYEPFYFDNLKPVWKYLVVDSSLLVYPNQDGTSHFFLRGIEYEEDAVYTMYMGGIESIFEGGMIEKLDIESGNRVWRNTFDARNHGTHISYLLLSMTRLEDGDLEFLFSRSVKPFLRIPSVGKLARCVLDDETGDTIALYHAPQNDSFADILTAFPNLTAKFLSSRREDNTLDNVLFFASNAGCVFLVKNVDFRGKLKRDTTIEVADSVSENYELLSSRVFLSPVAPDKYMYFYYFTDVDPTGPFKRPDTFIIKLGILDTHYRIHPITLQERGYSDSTDWISFNNFDTTQFFLINTELLSTNQANIKCRLFDFNGRLVKMLPDITISFFGYVRLSFYPFRLYYDQRRDEWWLFKIEDVYELPGHFALVIYKLEDDRWQLLRRFIIYPAKHYFRSMLVRTLDNGDFLFYVIDSRHTLSDSLSYWQYWMRIRRDDLVGVKSPETNSKKTSILCYPNPALQFVVVEFDRPFSGYVTIVDPLGRICKVEYIRHSKTAVIDVDNLQGGLYYLKTNRQDIEPVKLIIQGKE